MFKDEEIKIFNEGKLEPEFLFEIIIVFLTEIRERVLQRFLKEKATKDDRRFVEYLLVEVARGLYGGIEPWVFYHIYHNNRRLKDTLRLKHLVRYDIYRDYKRKRKRLGSRIDRIVKRNLKLKEGEIYVLDTTPIEVDLNRLRRGKKIKEGFYDAEFLHDTSQGTVVGYIACALINFTNLEVEAIEFYPKKTAKKRMWKEMVLERLGTTAGKVKVVIADAGFFAYDNILLSPGLRLIPVVKIRSNIDEAKIERMLENLPPNLVWYDKRYSKMFSTLLEDFSEIIRMTIQGLYSYEVFAELRSEIEGVFKVAKLIFGLERIHVYYRDQARPKVYFALYISSLFCQFCKDKNLSIQRITEVLSADTGLF